MTREEILAMEAGEDLDRLVAVEVMDLFCVYEPLYLYWPLKESWYDMDGRPANVEHYSTNISAAWLVVGELSPLVVQVAHYPSRSIYVAWVIEDRNGNFTVAEVEAKDAPEAICKAALLAKLEVKS